MNNRKIKIKKIIFYIFLSFVLASQNINAEENGKEYKINKKVEKSIELNIASNKRNYKIGEDIFIDVKIINLGNDAVIFYPALFPRDTPFSMPKSDINFEILDENKNEVPFVGVELYEKLEKPNQKNFMKLFYSWFWGRRINITKGVYKYRIQKIGIYKIKAIYQNYTRSWIKNQIAKKLYQKSDLDYPLENYLNEYLISNTIEINIIPIK